ncbi:MAG: PDZ domain-containing protein [Clostridia bacterium]|nr:PDZ domain-containing protein [Clostridia bacterium]
MTEQNQLQEETPVISYKRNKGKFNIKKFFTSRIFIILLCVILMVSSFFIGMHVDYLLHFKSSNDYALLTSVINYVNKYYYKDLDADTIIYYACKGVVDNLDPYSKIYKENTSATNDSAYYGIELNYGVNGEFRVAWVSKDSPADFAGIKVGEYIVSINGKDVQGDFIEDFVALMGNKKEGDKVTLGLTNNIGGAIRQVELTAQIIKSDEVHVFTDFSNLPGSLFVPSNVGYIGFTSFNEQTCEEFSDAVSEFIDAGKEYLILDLRQNVGGDGGSLTKIAKQLLTPSEDGAEKIVMKVVNADGNTSVYKTSGDGEYIFKNAPNGKIIALIDQNTASAAEALIGALILDGKTELVGVNTYGKGVGQSTVPFPTENEPLFSIKLTIGKYYFDGDVSSYVKNADGYVDCIDGLGFCPKAGNIVSGARVNTLLDDPVMKRAIELIQSYA